MADESLEKNGQKTPDIQAKIPILKAYWQTVGKNQLQEV